jgi:glyoxylase-like metal-dependent hydrolase (beta-lactamase superfamily II)
MSTLQLFEPASSTYTYILFDVASRDCVIIDPVDVTSARDIQARHPIHTHTNPLSALLLSFCFLDTNTIFTLFTSQIIRSLNLKPVLSIETHCHADHMSVLLLSSPAPQLT